MEQEPVRRALKRVEPSDMPPKNVDYGELRAPAPPHDQSRDPGHVIAQIASHADAQTLLRMREANKSFRNVVRDWGDQQVTSLVTDAPSFMQSAPRQAGTPYPDMRETQRRIAVAATASPSIESLETTLGPQSSAAPDVPFKEGGGFTFRTKPLTIGANGPGNPADFIGVPRHQVEAHPGGGQHSGKTHPRGPIPSTAEFGGAYIRTNPLKTPAQTNAKDARRFGMYGEFAPRDNFWAPLGDPPRESFDQEKIATHSTASLIRTGATTQDAAKRAELHAELLRRFKARQSTSSQ